MSVANILTLYPTLVSSRVFAYTASQELMNILLVNGFHAVNRQREYKRGDKIYFQKKGVLLLTFLPDERIHIMNSPIAEWSLHDSVTTEELRVLIAYSSLSEIFQTQMREALAPYCDELSHIFYHLSKTKSPWKKEFLLAYGEVELV